MASRVLVQLMVTGLQVAAALVALGAPDIGQAGGFMTGAVPTVAGAIALLQILLWLMVLGACGLSLRAIAGQPVAVRRPPGHLWAGAVLAAGVCLLLAGATRHIGDPAVTMTGGSLREAAQELGR